MVLTELCKLCKASTLFKLCKDLDQKDIMPAIIFNFSRTECIRGQIGVHFIWKARKEIERMLKKLVEELERLQYNKCASLRTGTTAEADVVEVLG